MKVKVIDTGVINPHGNGYFTFVDELKSWIKVKRPNIKSVRFEHYCDSTNFVAIIIYEDPSSIKQKSFDSLDPNTKTDSLINDFLKKHDVINVEHFGGDDVDTVTTVITYKEHENE